MTRQLIGIGFALGCLSLASADPPRLDRAGDPLPAGAVARLGSPRWRGLITAGSSCQFEYSPDGKAIVCRMPDDEVAWLDAETGGQMRRVICPVRFLTFAVTPDGKTLITTDDPDAGEPWGLRLWDVATGSQRAFVAGRTAHCLS